MINSFAFQIVQPVHGLQFFIQVVVALRVRPVPREMAMAALVV
jgi:hypothetical protein